MNARRVIVCADCGQARGHNARGLCKTCYARHRRRDDLDRFSLVGTRKDCNPWRPVQARSRGLVEDYEFLLAAGVTDREALAARLGISGRHLDRVASAHRALASTEVAR